jgi:uncharacterized protein with PIN domain
MKFIADVMLGRLARFMRFAGYDVEYDSKATDDFLFQRARYKTLLTRDRELARRASKRKVYFVQTTGAENQLEEIQKQFPLKNTSPRCLLCNRSIVRVAKKKISHLVPPFVYRTQERFFRCKCCNQIYWKGTHFDRLSRVIQFESKRFERGD